MARPAAARRDGRRQRPSSTRALPGEHGLHGRTARRTFQRKSPAPTRGTCQHGPSNANRQNPAPNTNQRDSASSTSTTTRSTSSASAWIGGCDRCQD